MNRQQIAAELVTVAKELVAVVREEDFKREDGTTDWDAYKEAQAMEVGNNRAKLKRQLMDARSSLKSSYKAMFKNPVVDFRNKRILSDDGTLAIQWVVRRHPNRPPSYNNQQTSVGAVFVIEM